MPEGSAVDFRGPHTAEAAETLVMRAPAGLQRPATGPAPGAEAPARGAARPLRVALRSSRLVAHVLVGLGLAIAINLDPTRRLQPEPLLRWWSRRVLRVLDVRLRVSGPTPPPGCVLMANHVSWLDINAIGASTLTRFVSKAEVRNWPVAGWLANASGTFYLRRGKGGARPLLEALIQHLQVGGSVTIFPEGTTSGGDDVLSFHPRLFAAAIESGTPVVPVTLRYGPGRGGARIAPFVGDDDLLSHLLRLLREGGLDAEVIFHPAIGPAGHSRESLATATRAAVRSVLL